MSKLEFDLKPVKKKPSRIRTSKYDPLLDEFLEGIEELVEATMEGKTANYLRTQLNKRIEARGLDNQVKASVVNDICYLEKV